MTEMRVFFEKTDQTRFISHLDLNRTFTRALFASQLPVWFTEGFNRHPHLVFGQPLPLGMAGKRETLDMRMIEEVSGAVVVEKLNMQLPHGIRVVDAASPQHSHKDICFACYRLDMDASYLDAFTAFWAADRIPAEKKTKRAVISFDLKKEVKELQWDVKNDRLVIQAIMPCSFECSIGPAVLMKAFEQSIAESIFCYSTRERFLLHDLTDFT